MDSISQSTRTEIPKGASNKVDLAAARIIERKGIDYLDSITKKHFANRTKALNLVQKKHNN